MFSALDYEYSVLSSGHTTAAYVGVYTSMRSRAFPGGLIFFCYFAQMPLTLATYSQWESGR